MRPMTVLCCMVLHERENVKNVKHGKGSQRCGSASQKQVLHNITQLSKNKMNRQSIFKH
jgi:hypothetical protein